MIDPSSPVAGDVDQPDPWPTAPIGVDSHEPGRARRRRWPFAVVVVVLLAAGVGAGYGVSHHLDEVHQAQRAAEAQRRAREAEQRERRIQDELLTIKARYVVAGQCGTGQFADVVDGMQLTLSTAAGAPLGHAALSVTQNDATGCVLTGSMQVRNGDLVGAYFVVSSQKRGDVRFTRDQLLTGGIEIGLGVGPGH